MDMTLVVMAAGLGSRYGGGIKQLAPVGPNQELIIYYSIYDAVAAGFNKIVFVIRKDLEEEVKAIIGDRIEKALGCDVAYAFQELDDLPDDYTLPSGRTKPWGTGHAVLAARDLIEEPFCVINSDDYYGKEAFFKIHDYLSGHRDTCNQYCMAGYILKNTLSENGSVTRGICEVNDENYLLSIRETYKLMKTESGAAVEGGDPVDAEAYVSMNIWGFTPKYLNLLETGFIEFLDTMPDPLTAEYLLPNHVDGLIGNGKVTVQLLETGDRWLGITYASDKAAVEAEFQKMVNAGIYKSPLM